MAPPATKRRKINHDEIEHSSDQGDSDFPSNGSIQSDAPSNDSDSDSASDEDGDINQASGAVKQHAPVKAPKVHRGEDLQLQNGFFTADNFKSNVFKLQVEELLEQVKPTYGKKEAPTEKAMRTLKKLIEQLPSREPLSVRRKP